MKNKFILLTGIAVVILVAGFFYNKYQVAPKIKFETLELTDLDGNKFSLDSFQHKKLFINFFATWCGPCVKELPSLLSAQQKLLNKNFQFILISDEPVERLKNFSERMEMKFLILHSEKKLQDYRIFSIPASYILNSKREIAFKKSGEEDWATDKMIKQLKEIE